MSLSQTKASQSRDKTLQSKLPNFASPSANSKANLAASTKVMDTDETTNASTTPEDTTSDRDIPATTEESSARNHTGSYQQHEI